jgi:hypothetical protein
VGLAPSERVFDLADDNPGSPTVRETDGPGAAGPREDVAGAVVTVGAGETVTTC